VTLPLFRRSVAANRNLLLATGLAMIVWGAILPLIYATFGQEIGSLVQGNPMFEQFSQFGGGDLFSLEGTIALGFVHPFTLLILGIVAIGYPAQAIAGERAKGTLEVLLARPISRIGLYATLLVAGLIFLGVLLALQLAGAYVSAGLADVTTDLQPIRMAELWLAGWLLFVAFMTLTFLASSLSDRIGPAIGIPLAFVLLNYLANVIGSLWPDMAWLQDWSMFTLVKAKTVLDSGIAVSDVAILVAFTAVFVALTVYLFPRRDIAAPT
jgi:ABC-2 type transport system permease protein